MKTQKKVQIDLYTDVVCPWCWLGKRRLEKALESLPEVEADIRYLPYELNPTTPEEGLDRVKHLKEKYGPGIDAMDARIAGFGKEVGLEYNFEKVVKVPNTFNAHRVIWLASQEGVQNSVIEALHEAYFRDGKDIGDNKVLADVAVGGGLAKEKVEQLLGGEEGIHEVRLLEKASQKMGLTGVPFFVFNTKSAVSGAHPVETFVSILKELVKE